MLQEHVQHMGRFEFYQMQPKNLALLQELLALGKTL